MDRQELESKILELVAISQKKDPAELNLETSFKKDLQGASVQMVALVIPYESGLSAAFEGDPSIFIYAVDRNVLLLSPITFYAFLKSVALGWSEYDLAKSANEIAQLSKELVDRFDVFLGHFDAIGTGLDKAAASYNKAIGSYNTRLNATFNKLRNLKQMPDVPMLETAVTTVNSAVDAKDD